MDFKDYYATLGVSREASADEIQKAYRKLARKFHPDVNSAKGAEDRFKEITEAYEVLKDPEKRSTYDQFGADWKQAGRGGVPPGWQNVRFDFGGAGGGASGFSSFFDALFGGGARRGGGFGGFGESFGNNGGRDQEVTLALSLEEAAAGGQQDVTIQDSMTGQSRKVTFNLPKGVLAGKKLRLAGKGLPGPTGHAGDLYLKVDLKAHPRFRLEGRDLHTDLPVTPWQAALGGEISVRTFAGSVKLKVPAGSSTGRKIRLRGKGWPDGQGGDGDLYAEIKVMVPEELSERERELFEELAAVSTFKPR